MNADTIVALATPPGRGALAIVRLSGAGVRDVWRRCFLPGASGASPAAGDPEPRHAAYGRWATPLTNSVDGIPARLDSVLDEVVATFYAAPASFTGEDSLEVTCHGSELMAERIVRACLAAGARPAHPGEFSRRAFENGRIDLLQARAVAELIDAETAEAQRQALLRLRGGLSDAVHAIENDLLDASAMIEAYLDFPDEDLGGGDRDTIRSALASARAALARLLATHRRGRLLQRGARVVLAGRPNAGKSSLFNALLGSHRAIVSPHPGTTRDTLEGRVDLDGLAVTLVDTAGLRHDPDHDVERLGIARTRAELMTAQAVVWLVEPESGSWRDQLELAATTLAEARGDSSVTGLSGEPATPENAPPPATSQPIALAARAPGRAATLLVWSKSDLAPPPAQADLDPASLAHLDAMSAAPPLTLSETDPESVEALARALRAALLGGGPPGHALESPPAGSQITCADAEQAHQLTLAATALNRAIAAFEAASSGELVMIDLREALDSLATLTGTTASEAMLDRLFARFCLGK
jgi:tRNA modification GTPase